LREFFQIGEGERHLVRHHAGDFDFVIVRRDLGPRQVLAHEERIIGRYPGGECVHRRFQIFREFVVNDHRSLAGEREALRGGQKGRQAGGRHA